MDTSCTSPHCTSPHLLQVTQPPSFMRREQPPARKRKRKKDGGEASACCVVEGVLVRMKLSVLALWRGCFALCAAPAA